MTAKYRPIEEWLSDWASCRPDDWGPEFSSPSYLIRGDAERITVELRAGGLIVSDSIKPVDLLEDPELLFRLIVQLTDKLGRLPA